MKIEAKTLKGFRDYGAQEQSARQVMFAVIQTTFEQFGFSPLSTPALEYKEILMGKYGDDEKLVYSFEDNGGRQVAMRYDLTVPLARYVAENIGSLTWPFKRYQIAPVWRADNPQKGRLREFYQCDVDVVNSGNVLSDAEVIACLAKTLENLGIVNYQVRINDRAVFTDFSNEVIRVLDKYEKIGLQAMQLELKQRGVREAEIEQVTALTQGKIKSLPARLEQVIQAINKFELQGSVVFDPTIARGLDYYSGTVFEITLPEKPEYGSIAGGGRYDGLLTQFSNEDLPAVGGSIGIDRLFGALAELGLLPSSSQTKVLVMNVEPELWPNYIALCNQLRQVGLQVELFYESQKLEKQFKYAEKKQISWALVMGTDELARGEVNVKNLASREQTVVKVTDIAQHIIKLSGSLDK